jgi:hypothetical protein
MTKALPAACAQLPFIFAMFRAATIQTNSDEPELLRFHFMYPPCLADQWALLHTLALHM